MVDETVLRRVESALEVAKFAPKKDELPPSVDMLLEQMETDLKAMLERCQQMRDAWDDVAQNALSIGRRIRK